jgi:hypothetical protein
MKKCTTLSNLPVLTRIGVFELPEGHEDNLDEFGRYGNVGGFVCLFNGYLEKGQPRILDVVSDSDLLVRVRGSVLPNVYYKFVELVVKAGDSVELPEPVND